MLVTVERNLCLAHWSDSPAEGDVAGMAEACRSWQRELGTEQTACMNVVRATAARPSFSPAVRKELADFFSDDSVYRLGFVHVFELGGLAGATVRAVLNTAFVLTRPVNPVKSVGDVEAAISQLTGWYQEGPERWTAEQVREAEAQAREWIEHPRS